MAISPKIIIDPANIVGNPTVNDHKVPLATLGEHIKTFGLAHTCEDYGLTREEALVVAWFLGSYGITQTHRSGKRYNTPRYRITQSATYVKKWRKWAEQNAENFRTGSYDIIPDPPTYRWKRKNRTQDTTASHTVVTAEYSPA